MDGMSLQLTEGLMIADRFRLIRELGRGGMGAVWLAEHVGLEVPCAVKFIDRERRESEELRLRFEREAKAAAQLRSPNVVQILDYGIFSGVPYIAMEYLEGEDLAQRLDRVWVLSFGETCYIVSQVARALSKAHSVGIVHRDMKPENIFIARDDDEEVAKVLDFGIAKRAQDQLGGSGTKTGSLLGTPFYMSPEQARGVKAVDYRSDLWSLAVITFQCLTGRLPFESEGLGDVLAKIMYEPLPVPSSVKPDLPAAFDAWWERAAARDVSERFQSAKELADELGIALGITHRLEIAALAPRLEQVTWVNPSLGGDSGVKAQPRDATNTQAVTLDGDTDQPYARTFPSAPSRRRVPRRHLMAASAGAAVLLLLAGTFYLIPATPEASVSASAPPSASAPSPPPVVELEAPVPSSNPSPAAQVAEAAPDDAGAPAPANAAPAVPPNPAAGTVAKRPPTKKATPKQAVPQPPTKKTVDFGI
jgi:serine/threonine-protein kinase